ncbi:hypothetical protein BDR04DRAFT_767843 [Suillus decipiens]|nr:hypothetical protein BDR04DRAFT_767843 [Suillus decipiens]
MSLMNLRRPATSIGPMVSFQWCHPMLSYSPTFYLEFKEQCNALAEQNGPVLGVDIPGQEQDGYDMEPSFFHGVYQHSQPQPQQRPGGLKGLRRAMTSTSRSVPSPAPAPTPSLPTPSLPTPSLPTPSLPTPSPSAIAPTAITARLGNLFSWRSHHAGPRVINVPFARDLQVPIQFYNCVLSL